MTRNMKKNWPIFALGSAMLAGLILPLASGASAPGFYLEVLIGGLMSGVLYSLVAPAPVRRTAPSRPARS